jgi:hypothetical protein
MAATFSADAVQALESTRPESSNPESTLNDSGSIPILPPVIVKGVRVKSSTVDAKTDLTSRDLEASTSALEFAQGSEVPLVQVPVGVGAKPIEPSKNELGVPLTTMEHEDDLSVERRNSPWLLLPVRLGSQNQMQVQTGDSPTTQQRVRLRHQQYSLDSANSLELGLVRDRRWVLYQEIAGPQGQVVRTSPDADSKSYQNYLDQGYFQWRRKQSEFESLIDFDEQIKDVYVGFDAAGLSKTRQSAASARWNFGYGQSLMFLQWRRSEFLSNQASVSSTQTQGGRIGVKWDFAHWIPEGVVSPSLTVETMIRRRGIRGTNGEQPGVGGYSSSFIDEGPRSHYQRQQAALAIVQSGQWFESQGFKTQWRGHFNSSVVLDRQESMAYLQKQQQTELHSPTLDLGLELSTSRWLVRTRGYTQLPTPTQRFGDGALLMPSAGLKAQSGLQAAAGPWFQINTARLEILPFLEQTENEPLTMAVSPMAAKTINMGSVVARGVELRFANSQADSPTVTSSAKLPTSLQRSQPPTLQTASSKVQRGEARERFLYELVYSFQQAVNNSAISWQRGKTLPGRPAHSVRAQFEYRPQYWRTGATYEYLSQDAMDFSGLWFKAPHHELGAYLGYGTKTWEVQLRGAKLLAQQNQPPSSFYPGAYGVNLLESNIEQTEIQLLCEFLF